MENLIDIFSTPFWQALVQALLHSLWIGPVILGLALIALCAAPVGKFDGRYVGVLFAQVSLIIFTCLLWGIFHNGLADKPLPTPSSPGIDTSNISIPDVTAGVSSSLPVQTSASPSTRQWKIWLAPVWMTGVGIFLGILLCDTSRARQLWRSSKGLNPEVAGRLSPLLEDLSRRLSISREVSIKVTECLHHPAVSGFLKPVIILPARFLEKATPKTLKAVLAHELAHIRRHDFLINMIQRVLESLLFFNPAMWILGNMVRTEREAACDAMAIDVIGGKLAYVEGVTDWIAESSDFDSLRLSTAIDGESDSGMVDRIKRILFPGRRPLVPVRLRTILLSLLVIGFSIYSLQRGSMAIAQVLSDEERVAVSKELRAERKDAASRTKPYELRVTIKHKNGSIPLKDELFDVHLSVNVRKWNGNVGSYGISALGNAEYVKKIESGVCKVRMSSAKWAPFATAYLVPEEGIDFLEVEIPLDPGEPAWFVLKDLEGNPVPDVRLSAVVGGNGSYLSYRTDSDGLAKLALNKEEQYNVSIRDPRFAWMDLKSISVAPGQTVPIQLKEGSPLELTFRSKTTGQPVLGEIRNASGFNSGKPKPLAVTDETGQLTLKILGKSDIRDFCFLSDEGHRVFLPGISPHGGSEKLVELPDPVTISGWIDLSGPNPPLPDDSGKYQIQLSGSASWEEGGSHGWSRQFFAQAGKDKRAYFSVNSVWPGYARIYCGSAAAKVKVSDQSIHNLVLKQASEVDEPKFSKAEKRDFLIRFQGPKKSKPFTGEMKYRYTSRDSSSPYYHHYEWMSGQSVDGVMIIPDVPISCPFTFELGPDGLNGFWFSEVRHTFRSREDIPDEGSPVEIDVDLLPAGGIEGQIFESDGTPASGVMISARHIMRGIGPHYKLARVKSSSSPDDQISRYFAGPLPLGAVYRICAHRGDSYVFGPSVSLTEKSSFQTVDLRFAEGNSVSGRVVLPDGSPVFAVNVKLDFEITGIGGFSNEGTKTNVEGKFQFNHVDLDNGGVYRVEIGGDRYDLVGDKTVVSKKNFEDLLITVKKRN